MNGFVNFPKKTSSQIKTIRFLVLGPRWSLIGLQIHQISHMLALASANRNLILREFVNLSVARPPKGWNQKEKPLQQSWSFCPSFSFIFACEKENDYGQERWLLQGFVWFLPAFWPGQCSLTTLPFPHTNNFFQKRKRNRVWEREDSRQRLRYIGLGLAGSCSNDSWQKRFEHWPAKGH